MSETTTRSAAQEYEDKRQKEIREQIMLGKKPSRKWAEAELRWLQEMQHKKCIAIDIQHFKLLEPFLYHYHLKDITKDVIEEIAKSREKAGSKPAAVNRLLALVRAVLNKAYKQWEWIDRVPNVRREVFLKLD